ncbi:hypothetical protein PENTCL1PPCAC_30727, partial [Pristionchus entomophagus]
SSPLLFLSSPRLCASMFDVFCVFCSERRWVHTGSAPFPPPASPPSAEQLLSDMMLLQEMPSASGLVAKAPSSTVLSMDPSSFNLSAFMPVSSSGLLSTQFLASVATSHPSLFASLLPQSTVPSTSTAMTPSSLSLAPSPSRVGGPIVKEASPLRQMQQLAPQPPPPLQAPAARSTRVFDEKCVVCSDRATGLHYSVPSCNGCKTFFRRTIICGRRFKCHKDGQCTFNKQGRCSCRACRFQKCLDSGMDPQAIQQSRHAPYPIPSTSYADQKDVAPSCYATKDLGEMLGDALTRPDSPLSPSVLSSTGVSPVPPQLDTKSIQSLLENEELRDLVNREIKMYGLRRSGAYRGGALLDILTKPPAIENKEALMEMCESPVFIHDLARTEFWLNYELSISIEYAKTHAVFRNLSFCDKCVLLEDTHLALFIFTAAYEAYFKEGKALHYSNGDEVVFGEDTGSPNDLIDIMTRCCLDPATFALSKAIIFLNPDAYGLSPEGKKLLEKERDRHTRLLASYTFQRFNARGATVLGESILLPATCLALGRRMRLRPPANATLLYISTPMPVKKEV